MYRLFYDGEKPPAPIISTPAVTKGWGSSGSDAKTLHKFRRLMSRTNQANLNLLLFMAQKMSQKNKRSTRGPSS